MPQQIVDALKEKGTSKSVWIGECREVQEAGQEEDLGEEGKAECRR